MKAREISKVAVVLVAAMMISSASMAAPNGHSKNCSGVTSTDGAIWGGNGPLRVSESPNGTLNNNCPGTQVTLSNEQTRTERGRSLAHAFGKFLSGLGISIDGTTWDGGGYIPPRFVCVSGKVGIRQPKVQFGNKVAGRGFRGLVCHKACRSRRGNQGFFALPPHPASDHHGEELLEHRDLCTVQPPRIVLAFLGNLQPSIFTHCYNLVPHRGIYF
jgi:hypothetical protein